MESELLNQLQENIKELLAKSSKPLALPEAAQYLGLSISCLYKLTSQNLIKHYKHGKRIYFKNAYFGI